MNKYRDGIVILIIFVTLGATFAQKHSAKPDLPSAQETLVVSSVGYVDVPYITAQSLALKSLFSSVEEARKTAAVQLQPLESAARAAAAEVEAKDLTEKEKKAAQTKFEAANTAYQTKLQETNDRLRQLNDQFGVQARGRIEKAAAMVAKSRGLLVIVERNGVYTPATDCTGEVLRLIDTDGASLK